MTGAMNASVFPVDPILLTEFGMKFTANILMNPRNVHAVPSGTAKSASATLSPAQSATTSTTHSLFADADALRAHAHQATSGMTQNASASLPQRTAQQTSFGTTLMESVSVALHGNLAQILAPSLISLTGMFATADAVAPLLLVLQISTSTLTAALASASQSSTVVSMKRTLTESSTPVPANSSALLSNATKLESTGINYNAHADASTKHAQPTTSGTLIPAAVIAEEKHFLTARPPRSSMRTAAAAETVSIRFAETKNSSTQLPARASATHLAATRTRDSRSAKTDAAALLFEQTRLVQTSKCFDKNLCV